MGWRLEPVNRVRPVRSRSFGSGVACLNAAMLDNFLGLFLVERCKLAAGVILDSQEFIQFGVNSLCIAVLGALDKEGHDPCRERRCSLPIESVRRNYQP
jgi:hypothetical protein